MILYGYSEETFCLGPLCEFFLADLGLFSLVLVHLLFFLYDPLPYLRKDLIDSDQHS